jgi:hypothetical protein
MMRLHLTLDIPKLPKPISYTDKILLIGSCFTEHMSDRLGQHKFRILSNPHGILFNPLSVADSLKGYLENKLYSEDDLFQLNELWNSWDHHTRFSHIDKNEALKGINDSQSLAADFLKEADWIMITLGSAFQYYLKETDKPVANNHRAPSQWFEKRLLSIDTITTALSDTLRRIQEANPSANILFTISPVRHIRDGVIDNNRSKARLIEAVHELWSRHSQAHYFPAYELVIDILRDYRYYDVDFVHPNYLATTVVWEHFVDACIEANTKNLMQQVQEIATARRHKPRFPQTEAHQKFKAAYAEKIKMLQKEYPFLQLDEDLAWFSE